MARERARRRAERMAVLDARRLDRERAARRAMRWHRLSPQRLLAELVPRRRRTARPYSRRTRGQRATIIACVLAVEALVWVNTDSWPVRLAAALLAAVATPALVTLTLDRSSR